MQLIVIGGGAAGFFCAVTAARLNPDCRVTILEKSNKLLSKVRISGGGRCNVTHACFSITDMVKKYPRGQNFVKKTFHQFFTEDTITWFRERGVLLKTEADGRMFPVTDSSETIINCLLKEADKYRVQVSMRTEVSDIELKDGKWKIITSKEEIDNVDAVCVACGGYAKEVMFNWLSAQGHTFESPVPSLFTFNIPKDPITMLMGISTSARVKIKGTKLEERGPVLITHWGLSGPAVLKLSAQAARELAGMNYHFTVIINWCSTLHETQVRELFLQYRDTKGKQLIANRNELAIPQRLWEYVCGISGVEKDLRWSDLSAVKQNALIRNLTAQECKVSGKTTYKEEFVTAGGIRLPEIDANTMESRVKKGLYFAGEVMDVDGVTGGFNFQHAWTSGFIAGKSIAALGNRTPTTG
ncbi:MAG: NAD(P)/FAD-dependent oxidoreductase [Flavitalea sp.]